MVVCILGKTVDWGTTQYDVCEEARNNEKLFSLQGCTLFFARKELPIKRGVFFVKNVISFEIWTLNICSVKT